MTNSFIFCPSVKRPVPNCVGLPQHFVGDFVQRFSYITSCGSRAERFDIGDVHYIESIITHHLLYFLPEYTLTRGPSEYMSECAFCTAMKHFTVRQRSHFHEANPYLSFHIKNYEVR